MYTINYNVHLIKYWFSSLGDCSHHNMLLWGNTWGWEVIVHLISPEVQTPDCVLLPGLGCQAGLIFIVSAQK